MIIETIGNFCVGTAVGLSLASPAEWTIHKYLLHASPKSRKWSKFIEGASRGHNDNHHGAYKAPEHYYRDITNEHEIVHFAKSDVGIIAGIAVAVGAALERTHAFIANNYRFDETNASFIAGVLLGTMGYYGCYEFIHHHMHVLGKRRLTTNRVLGDTIQGGAQHRDGNLRLSKPLLDDICNAIEKNIDCAASVALFRASLNNASESNLSIRLINQIKENSSSHLLKPYIAVEPNDAPQILATTYENMMKSDEDYRAALSTKDRMKYTLEKRLQKTLRASSMFSSLDNHHFIHHRKYGKNLNVVFPLMDYLEKTKVGSTAVILEERKDYWLCPNSPDEKRFKRKDSAVNLFHSFFV